ncbi:MAG: AmmeMemoRadiSam system protein A [Anaerolineae bacterium]|nr:AmmeMemoRadiSam system protein A [Anaerolineae bacterium]
MQSFVKLAYQAIELFLRTGQTLSLPDPLPKEMAEPGAVFVSLHTADGQLRGCRGTITPTEPNLAEAIIHTAIASATDDPRFPPMVLSELGGLEIKVDVLSEMEPVSDPSELDEKVYGVLIQAGYRRALLLPDIAAVDSVPRQLELVRRKAGIGPDEPADLFRFTVTRHTRDN